MSKHTNAEIEMQFQFVNERWRNVWSDGELLADVLKKLDIIVDDNCEYARFHQTYLGRTIIYHVYGGHIKILINYDKSIK